jgi:hypothetical protein
MSLFETLQKDMYQAMKAGDKVETKALRRALARLKDKRIERREELSEGEEIKALQSLAKQHEESIQLYRQGNREDLVAAETAELNVLKKYLPSVMTEEETRQLVEAVIQEVGATSLADLGKVMPVLMKRGAGRLDGRRAQALVKERLGAV